MERSAVRRRHEQLEQEPIELCLRQRVRALHFQGILRGQHDVGRSNLVALAADGDTPLLHRLEQGALRLGSRSIDLIGEHDPCEDGARPELDAVTTTRRGLDHVRTDDVSGHQIRRELDA